jgi:CRP-like cAMP-binding protein
MEALLSDIRTIVPLSNEEENAIKDAFSLRILNKKETLMEVGGTFSHLGFVLEGILRTYLPAEEETEHVIQFAPENSWVPDSFNLMQDEISKYNIEAIENSKVLLIERHKYQSLLAEIPQLEKYFRVAMQKRLEALHLRVINYLSHFAEDKYKMFLDVYPEIVQRVPQHMIASYLGIKPETLSRNRKKMATRKSSQ